MAFFRSLKVTEDPGATLVAINRDKNSQFAVKWAVESLLTKSSICILVHVRNHSLHPRRYPSLHHHHHHHHHHHIVSRRDPQYRRCNILQSDQARPKLDGDTDSKEGRPPTEAELQQFFLPYRGFCARKGIVSKEVVLHDIDVPNALVDYVINNSISTIVVGASHRNVLTRKFRDSDVASSLLKSVPETCAVYVISKGKVQSSRYASRLQTPRNNGGSQKSQFSETPQGVPDFPQDVTRMNYSGGSSSSGSSEKICLDKNFDFKKLKPPKSRSGSKSNSPAPSVDSITSECSSNQNSVSGHSDLSGPLSFQSNGSDNADSFMNSDGFSNSSQTPSGFDAEMKKLRTELKQTMDMYNLACKEALAAKQKAWDLQKWRTTEERKLEEAKMAEEAAVALAEMEKQKSEAATDAAIMAQRLAEMETQKRRIAERKAKAESEERRKAMEALSMQKVRYRRYSIEEVEVATDYFKNSNKIGEGGYGPVYKGLLDHTPVAIKVLRPDISQGQKQFQQEVEVLSCIRHPHMVILVGACPEYGCLVYEYMGNGSLEDRLYQKNNTPPIPWEIRFKIAAEIATALLFLHQKKPEPLVHRDLKPGNILLDQNYVSKIADVGLARLVPPSVADSITMYHMTAAAGTFCYIDPEYQQTGMLGVKSDIYSLGVMLLQIITAKPPMGLSHHVQEAIEKGTFSEILDPSVTDWPVEEALSYAKMALKCCELRKRDRPDLSTVIVPELNRLRDLGSTVGSNEVLYAHHPSAPLPPIGSPSAVSQINARRKWMQLESMTKMLSFKKTFFKVGSSSFSSSSSSKNLGGRLSKKPVEGCWSFVSTCSPTHARAPLKRFNSFS